MPVYMYEHAYTPEALAAQLKNPVDRIKKVAEPIGKAAGGKLLGGWYAFGEYDLILIFDLPDNEAMAAVGLAFGAGGSGRASRTRVLMTSGEMVSAMKKVASVSLYKPPS